VVTFQDVSATGLVPGQLVRLEVGETIESAGFWLPTSALLRRQRGLWCCYVVVVDRERPSTGRVETRDLEVLHTEGQRVFVRGTLQPGETVIAAGTHRVVPGQRVVP
jgi:multidrug efflux pump subunit AcrA (membrane-fusion protein)